MIKYFLRQQYKSISVNKPCYIMIISYDFLFHRSKNLDAIVFWKVQCITSDSHISLPSFVNINHTHSGCRIGWKVCVGSGVAVNRRVFKLLRTKLNIHR